MEEAIKHLEPILQGTGMYHSDLLNGHYRSLTMIMDFEAPIRRELSHLINKFMQDARNLGARVEICDHLD